MKQEILHGAISVFQKKSPISTDEIVDYKSILNSKPVGNKHKLIFAHLNINSIRNKFDLLAEQVTGSINILMISEIKIDESVPVGSFLLPGFCFPYRFERDSKDDGILLYV